MKRKQIVAAAIVALVVASPVLAADLLQRSYSDGPAQSSQWTNSTYSGDLTQPDYNGSSSEIRLKHNDVSKSEGGFGDADNPGDDTAETSSDIHLRRGRSAGSRWGTGESLSESRTTPGSAFSGDRVWYLGDYLHQTAPGGHGSVRMCDIASNTPGQPRGLANGWGQGPDWELTIMGYDKLASTTNFYRYDPDSCTKDKLTSFSVGGGFRGLAPHESNPDKRYYINGIENKIGSINLNDGSRTSVLSLPGGKQRGFDIKQWPDGTVWFLVSYQGGNGEEELQIIEKSTGNVVKTFTSSNGDTYTAAWHHGNSEKNIFTVDSNNNIEKITPVNLWQGDGQANVKYRKTLTQESTITNHDVKSISWTGEAPSTFKGSSGKIQLQVKNLNGNWQTVDSYSAGKGSFTQTVSLGSNFHGLEKLTYRVAVTNNYKIRGGAANPKVTDVSWNYDYYGNPGTVESVPLDTDGVNEFQNLTLNGSSGGENIDVAVVDKDGNVEYQSENVAGNDTLNLSNVPVDYSTQEVSLRFTLESSGLSTPGITGWELNYLRSEIEPPKIEESYAIIGGNNTTAQDGESGVSSTDTFVIEDVNEPVDEVTWYVNGEAQKNESVSGDGAFSYERKWEETGQHTVVGEVYNESSGKLNTVVWNVTVYDILIGGKDSYTESAGSSLETVQRFEVFGVPSTQIDFEITWNDSVVQKISGPQNGTVVSGNSRAWQFRVVTEDYEGTPITITATYGNMTSTKDIYLSTSSSGALYGGGGGDGGSSLLSNTWLSFLIGGLTTQVYFVTQAILTAGWVVLLWGHHLGWVWIPDIVSTRLSRTSTGSKIALTLSGGSLTLGLGLLPWAGLTAIVGWGWLRFVRGTRLKEVIPA